MQSTRIVWRRIDIPGVEWCEVATTDDGIAIDGLVAVEWERVAHRVEYRIELDDAARTRRVLIRDVAGAAGSSELALEADGLGRWRRAGEEAVLLESPDAIDVDLGFTPLTNSLPIWRFDLEVGEARTIEVAWVRFPSLEVVHGRQTYTRIAERTWRYESSGFEADLEVGDDGLVERYGRYWEAVARG